MRRNNPNTSKLMPASRPRVMQTLLLLMISIVLLIPCADYYFDMVARRDSLADREQRTSRDELAKLDAQLADARKTELGWQSRVVTAHAVEDFQNSVIYAARQCGCQVRKASPGDRSRYPWMIGASPYARMGAAEDFEGNDRQPPTMDLTAQSLRLTLVGTFDQVQSFVKKIEQLEQLSGINSLRMTADDVGDEVQLELELVLFDLETRERQDSPRRSRA